MAVDVSVEVGVNVGVFVGVELELVISMYSLQFSEVLCAPARAAG